MSFKGAVIFGVVFSLAILVRQGLAMECYNCIKCNDPFDPNKYKDSKINCTGSCSKIKVDDLVTRTCIPLLKQNDCEEADDKAACQCTDNLCNSALMTQTSVFLTVFLTAASFLRKFAL